MNIDCSCPISRILRTGRTFSRIILGRIHHYHTRSTISHFDLLGYHSMHLLPDQAPVDSCLITHREQSVQSIGTRCVEMRRMWWLLAVVTHGRIRKAVR